MARKVGLTHESVVRAAASVADRDGFESLSLASVATELGVRSPSLYSHVEGLSGLRRDVSMYGARLLAAELASAADSDDGTGVAPSDPRSALVALAGKFRRFALEHPGLNESFLPAPSPDQDPELAAAFAEPVVVVAQLLGGDGLLPSSMIPRLRAFRSMIHGFIDLELRGGFGLSDDIGESFDVAVDLVVSALLEAPDALHAT